MPKKFHGDWKIGRKASHLVQKGKSVMVMRIMRGLRGELIVTSKKKMISLKVKVDTFLTNRTIFSKTIGCKVKVKEFQQHVLFWSLKIDQKNQKPN